ncbi:MAG TPA: hypothetical protein VNV88_16910 [Candidatus Solibacter sp.]|jgi:hypothetical protein|nr:hypothetical protein [Candidatus Solibacter sp.]
MKAFQKLTVLISMIFLVSAIPAVAQIDSMMSFETPFAFYAGDTKMPAGSYTVSQPDDDAQVLLIKSADGAHSAVIEYVPAESEIAATRSEITFNQYGTTDFLNHISLQGERFGMRIPASKAEQDAAESASAGKISSQGGTTGR